MLRFIFEKKLNFSWFELVFIGFIVGALISGDWLWALGICVFSALVSVVAQDKLKNNTAPPKK